MCREEAGDCIHEYSPPSLTVKPHRHIRLFVILPINAPPFTNNLVKFISSRPAVSLYRYRYSSCDHV